MDQVGGQNGDRYDLLSAFLFIRRMNVISDFARHCRREQIPRVLSGVRPQPFRQFHKFGISDEVGPENVCENIDRALIRVDEILAAQPVA